MASTSGSFTTTACEGRSLKFSWSQTSQSISDNTTTISWSLIGSGTFGGYVKCGNFKVVINEETVYEKDKDYRVKVYLNTQIASGSVVIKHGNNGKKTFSAFVEAGIYTGDVNCEGESSWELNTISRASQPSIVTWPTTTENIGDIGTEVRIHMNRASSSFTHVIKYKFKNLEGCIAEDVTNNYDWTIPLSFIEQLPNSTIGEGTIEVTTYNGDTEVGTKSVTFKTTVPKSYVPTVGAITLTPQTYKLLVQGKNGLTIRVSKCSAGEYSSIKSYTFSGPGVDTTSTTTETTTETINTTGTLTYTVTVTDARDRTASKKQTIQCYEWFDPWFTSFNVYRSDQKGNASDQGQYATIKCGVSYADVNGSNETTIQIQIRKDDETSWTSKTPLETSPSNAYTVELGDSTSTFVICATVTDKYGGSSTSRERKTTGEKKIVNILPGGNGVAFGKMAATQNVLDSVWPIKTDDPANTMQNLSLRKSADSIASTSEDTLENWLEQGNLATVMYTDSSTVKNPQKGYAFVLNLARTSDPNASQYLKQVHQILACQNVDENLQNLYHRCGTVSGTTSKLYPWKKILDESNCQDYVIEQKTASVTSPDCTWTYRKWKSGFAECFGHLDVSQQQPTGKWWPFVYYQINLPAFPFTFAQTPNVMVSWNGGNAAVIGNLTGKSQTSGGKIDLYRPPEHATNYHDTSTFGETSITGTIVITATGKWE